MPNMMDAFHIVRIENSTSMELQIRSKTPESNGRVRSGTVEFDLHDGQCHSLEPMTIYKSDWCVIPCHKEEKRYKSFKVQNSNMEIRFHCRDLGDRHAVIFENQHGTKILEQYYSRSDRKIVP